MAEGFAVTMSMYSALNVSSDASDAEIKKSFRELSLAYHPDRQQTTELKQTANLQFHKLHTMYEVLSDPVRRQAYDEFGDDGIEALKGKDDLVNKLQLTLHEPGTVKRKVGKIIQQQNQQELEARLNLHGAMMMEVRLTKLSFAISLVDTLFYFSYAQLICLLQFTMRRAS